MRSVEILKYVQRLVWTMVIVLGLSVSANSQDDLAGAVKIADSIETLDLVDYLPPLAMMIDSAVVNSPEVAFFDAQVKLWEYEVGVQKKQWAQNVTVSGGYNWSFGNQIIIAGISTGADQNQINEGYTFGVGISVPISTIYGRDDRIGKAESSREGEQMNREAAIRTVKETVIETYNSLLLQQKLLNITSEARESSIMISDIAEEKFRDGELSLEELGQSTELKAKYATEYEQLKTQFSNTYFQLERLVGVPFSKFERN